MDPVISNVQDDNYFKFRLAGVDVSVANSLRRIILSEIPVLVFRTSPHEENRVDIEANTSRFHNEIIKQRLSCIPVHISDPDFPHENFHFEIDKKNDTEEVMHITTEHFKMKDLKTDSYVNNSDVREIFPADSITGDYIDLIRLRPIGNEELRLKARLDIGTAKQDGAFNVVSTCSYAFAQDPIKVKEAWAREEKNHSGKHAKHDWMLIEGKRHTLPNTFDFVIETIGHFTNSTIMYKATQVMLKKLIDFNDVKDNSIKPAMCTIPNCFDIHMEGEDYTLGKVLEFIIYDKHFNKDKTVTFCGFKKPHPHIEKSYIRVGFAKDITEVDVANMLSLVVADAKVIYEKIGSYFKPK